jgi:WD40 repeat protein
MRTEIIEENEESLDDLVVRARNDSFVKRMIDREKRIIKAFPSWQGYFGENVCDLSWSADDKSLAVATKSQITFRPVNDSTNRSNYRHDKHFMQVSADAIGILPQQNDARYFIFYAIDNRLKYLSLSDKFETIDEGQEKFTNIAKIEAISFQPKKGYVVLTTNRGFHSFGVYINGFTGSINLGYKDRELGVRGAIKAEKLESGNFAVAVENDIEYYDSIRFHDKLCKSVEELFFDSPILDISAHKDNLAIALNERFVVNGYEYPWDNRELISKIRYSNKGDRVAVAFGANIWVYGVEDEN